MTTKLTRRRQHSQKAVPADVATEKSLLGQIVEDPSLFNYAAFLSVDDFHSPVFRELWATLTEIKRDRAGGGAEISATGVVERLRQRGMSDDDTAALIGDIQTGCVPDRTLVASAAQRLRNLAVRRQLAERAESIAACVCGPASDSAASPDSLLKEMIADLSHMRRRLRDVYSGGEVENGANLLSDLAAFVKRFVCLSDSQADILALWITHSYSAFDSDAKFTPYIHITSPTKRSGKTRCLELLSALALNPLRADHISVAALYRVIQQYGPTLLIDELDSALHGGDREYQQEIRNILNSGHNRNGSVFRCVVNKDKTVGVEGFSTFCCKVLAGIGAIPDTVRDRSIPIVLKRKRACDVIERLNHRTVEGECEALRSRCRRWAVDACDALRDATPVIPDSLDDRARDIVEPLLAIADLAGGEWPDRARRALLDIMSGRSSEDEDRGAQLLRDVQAIFRQSGKDKFCSGDLVVELIQIEGAPWGDFGGKQIDPWKIARLLKPFGIAPRLIRFDGIIKRGYVLDDFHDAFARYLPQPAPEHAAQSAPVDVGGTTGQPHPAAKDPRVLVPAPHTEPENVAPRATPEVSVTAKHSRDSAGNPPPPPTGAPCPKKKNPGRETHPHCHIHGRHKDWWFRAEDLVCGRCHPGPGVAAEAG